MSFAFKRLDVYRLSIELVGAAHGIAERIPKKRWFLADQLVRSATSVPLNLAEGAGELSPGEKARFYRMARRSAHECVAILDSLVIMGLPTPAVRQSNEALLDRIRAMLTRLAVNASRNRGWREFAPAPASAFAPEPHGTRRSA